jgi:ABC-2 type transport system permease protein
MVLIYGFAGVSAGVVPLLGDGIWTLGRQIHTGELDYRLTRPYPVLLQVMCHKVGFNGVGDTVASGLMLCWAFFHIHVHWNVVNVVMTALLVVSGMVLRMALCIAGNSLSFWFPAPIAYSAHALWQMGEMARYPITIYGGALKALLSTVTPFAFAAFFPATWLLHRGHHAWLGLLAPVVAIGYGALAVGVFRLGLRHYESSNA